MLAFLALEPFYLVIILGWQMVLLSALRRILESLKTLYYKGGLSAHYLLVLLSVHSLVEHWLTNSAELGLFSWTQSLWQSEDFFVLQPRVFKH
uniref:Uncharacterized protein n=1 Tax=Lotus japonicus TaxID=34305 RepID=I3T1C2_LOTJA|nr:unknown [Lotus japonicus]